MGQLCRLDQICYFHILMHISRQYLGGKFVCGLIDVRCQRYLLRGTLLTAETDLKKTKASNSKVVLIGAEGMQIVKEPEISSTMIAATTVHKQKYHPGVLPVWGIRS